jgi:tRNA A-37 threonylcarbamoyl transferase component Bud32
MNAVVHLDAKRLSAYMLGELPSDRSQEVESHLAGCTDCRVKAETLDGTSDTFLDCLRGAAREPAADPAVSKLLARAEEFSTGSLTPGPKTVAGHEIVRELARNGMGVIYLAHHPLLNDHRAIKRPLPKGELEREILLARFRREVQAVGNLKHDHIIRAHDAGSDGDGPYLVMEYIDGASLGELVARQGALPVPVACELVRQAALGLQVSHERGLVHRDVKPSNLMLARAGAGARVVVIDWGLVKRDGPTEPLPSEGLTGSESGMGTPDYMAPEQIHDARSADVRADIYSLAATLHCLLTARAPFHDRPQLQKLVAHDSEPFPPLSGSSTDVPKALAAVIGKMAAKKPADRYATPGEVAAALEPFCCGPDSGSLLALLGPAPGGAIHPVNSPGSPVRRNAAIPERSPGCEAPPGPRAVPNSPGRAGRKAIAIVAVVTIGLLFLGIMFGSTVIRYVSNKGVLIIHVDDPNVEVTVRQNGSVIVDKTTMREFTVDAGDGEVQVYEKESGVTFETKRFTISRGGRETVVVTARPAAAPPLKLGQNQVPPTNPKPTNGGDSEIDVGAKVIVTKYTDAFVDDTTGVRTDLGFVNGGTEGEVIAKSSADGGRSKVRLKLKGEPEAWIWTRLLSAK